MASQEVNSAYQILKEGDAQRLKKSEGLRWGKRLFKSTITTTRNYIDPLCGVIIDRENQTITLQSYPVIMSLGDTTAPVSIRATAPLDSWNPKMPYTPNSKQLPEEFSSVYVHTPIRGTDGPFLLKIDSGGNLTTPFKGNNDGKELKMASDLLTSIQELLLRDFSSMPTLQLPQHANPKPEPKRRRRFLGLLNPKTA